MDTIEYFQKLGRVKYVNGQPVIDLRGAYNQYANNEVIAKEEERKEVEKVEEPQPPERLQPGTEVIKKKSINKDVSEVVQPPEPKVIGKEPYLEEEQKRIKKIIEKYARPAPPEVIKKKKKKIIDLIIEPERRFKRKLDFSPEDEVFDDFDYSPRVYYDYDFSPFDFLSRRRKFAPRFFYDYEYAPFDYDFYSDSYAPRESYDDTFAPKYKDFRKSVYSPFTIRKVNYAPRSSTKIQFKPRLFDKLLAIFAPEAITKAKNEVKYKPYNYQFEQTAILGMYQPIQDTFIEKFTPKDNYTFNLRIAPETDFTIKTKPISPPVTSIVYAFLLKNMLR